MKKYYFEDFEVGDCFESPGMTLTESMIIDFAMHFDPQTFHTNVEAAKTSLYGGLIASGMHTFALSFRLVLLTGVLTNNLGSQGIDELRWMLPVRPGDTLHVEAEVIEIRASASRPDRGNVRFKYTTLNQRDEKVQTVL
ncbi:MAG: hypothetical protein CSYNP_03833 [Syntrophus sp. SKADARSKE-3]|nr:hypothetical protein [Syntrophus sp. SKADARSKE-3]